MIDQTPDGQYQVIGNRKLFPSLNELVAFHNTNKIVAEDAVCLLYPCGQVRAWQRIKLGFWQRTRLGGVLTNDTNDFDITKAM